MATEVKVPTTGNAGEPAVVLELNVAVGDQVSAGDVVATLETAKATVEVDTPAGGTVLDIRFQPGDEAPEHDVLMLVGEAGEIVTASAAPSAPADPSPSSTPASPPSPAASPTVEPAPERVADPSPAPRTRISISPRARRLAESSGMAPIVSNRYDRAQGESRDDRHGCRWDASRWTHVRPLRVLP